MSSGYDVSNNTALPAVFHEVVLTVKVLGGITCLLSILGCCVILFTYVFCNDLRTTARQLLVNLSIADILVSGSHFLGLYTNYERFLPDYKDGYNASMHDPWCITQGAVSIMGTLSSFLWTMAIPLYLVVIIVFRSPRAGKCVVFFSYAICWGLPVVPVVVSVTQRFIGFHPLADPGEFNDGYICRDDCRRGKSHHYARAAMPLLEQLSSIFAV